jgi:cellulose synthase (UDP-forming)
VFEVTFVELPKLFWKLTGWQKLSYSTIGTYYLVGFTQFFFTLLPFVFFATGILPAKMSFVEFIVQGAPIAILGTVIYLYVQRWMCHPGIERGIHWRGMVLKYACWPVFFMGFLLSIIDADIPYIPTAKKAVIGYFTPFARPLVFHIGLFVSTVLATLLYRRYFISETEILFSSEKTWGMIAFALLACIMSVGGVYAALEANRMTVEDAWASVDLDLITVPAHAVSDIPTPVVQTQTL